MAYFILSFLVSLFFISPFYLLIFLFLSWVLFMLSFQNFFVSDIFCVEGAVYYDDTSLFMVYMCSFVLFISYIYSMSVSSKYNLTLVFITLIVFCFYVFTCCNLIFIYLFYEASLLPILYIIVKWGVYSDRSLSAMMLLLYTSVFTLPSLFIIFYLFITYNSLFLPVLSLNFVSTDPLTTIIIFFAFAVNLPIYGLHFWLPMAHVEAPTFGSMILAGVLLKLGGVGLIRFSFFLDLSFLLNLLSYFMVFMVYVTLVCCLQSDFKRLVAYSSVSHIMAIPFIIIGNNCISHKSLILLIFTHGLSSPILFILVGLLYNFYSSRQLISIRGLVTISPVLNMFLLLAFFFTMSAPPFPSYISELMFMLSTLQLTRIMIPTFLIFCFLSIVYNLNWLTSISFSSSSSLSLCNSSCTISYLSFLPIFTSFLICLPLGFFVYLLWR